MPGPLAEAGQSASGVLEELQWNGRLDKQRLEDFDLFVKTQQLDVTRAQVGAQKGAIGLHLQQVAACLKLGRSEARGLVSQTYTVFDEPCHDLSQGNGTGILGQLLRFVE